MSHFWRWDSMGDGHGVITSSSPLTHAFVPDPNMGPQDFDKPMVCRACERPYADEVHVW